MDKKKYVALYKSGKFYNAYGDDAVIIFYLMGYKYSLPKKSAGFPESALTKVKVALETNNIAYKIYHKNELVEDAKGIDKQYTEVIKKGLKKLEMEVRLKDLYDKLDKFSLEQLERIVEGIEDARLNKE